jgi:hypothetical protein
MPSSHPRVASVALVLTAWLAAAPGTAHAADGPDGPGQVTVSSPVNRTVTDTLGSDTDVDWFRFTTTSELPRWSRVQLLGLPANYRLWLYQADGTTLVGSSARAGLANEEVYRSLPASTYLVRVARQSGPVVPDRTYSLRFDTLPDRVLVLSARLRPGSVDGEVLDNTPSSQGTVPLTVRLYDNAGRLLATQTGYVDKDVVRPRMRSSFSVPVSPPPGATRVVVTPTPSPTSLAPLAGVTLATSRVWSDAAGTHYEGAVTNRNGFAVSRTQIHLVRYDGWGRVRDVTLVVTDDQALAPGQSTPFSAVTPADRTVVRTGNVMNVWR